MYRNKKISLIFIACPKMMEWPSIIFVMNQYCCGVMINCLSNQTLFWGSTELVNSCLSASLNVYIPSHDLIMFTLLPIETNYSSVSRGNIRFISENGVESKADCSKHHAPVAINYFSASFSLCVNACMQH